MRQVLAACMSLLLPSAAFAADVTITGIRAHLFYQQTGRLSSNIIGDPTMALVNVMIGEGSAEEPAENYVIVFDLKGTLDQSLDMPLHADVTATAEDGTVTNVANKDFFGLYFSRKDTLALPLWIADADVCSKIHIKASLGTQTMEADIPFQCGD